MENYTTQKIHWKAGWSRSLNVWDSGNMMTRNWLLVDNVIEQIKAESLNPAQMPSMAESDHTAETARPRQHLAAVFIRI